MSAAVRALEKAGAGFGDVRTEDRNAFVVRVANEQIQSVNEVHRRGWGLRAFVDGAWGYASGTSGRSADAVQAARKAVVIARRGAAAGVPPSKLRKMPSTAITLEPKVRIEPRDVAGEEKVDAAMEVCRSEKREEVANTNASYADSDWTFELANTWGACLQWREVRIRIAGQAVAGEGDRRESAFDFRDGTAGWELVKALDLAAFGRGLAQEAVEMLSAAKPPAGLMTVVTDPGVSGLLAHEVMGHASEGDEIVKKRSFLTDQVGKKVGSALVSMYDDGTYPGAHGSIPFDAEGTPAHKTTDIDPLDLASDAVRRAQSEGADAAEAYVITFTSRSVYIEDDVPKVAEERSETGLGVRPPKAGKARCEARGTRRPRRPTLRASWRPRRHSRMPSGGRRPRRCRRRSSGSRSTRSGSRTRTGSSPTIAAPSCSHT